MYYKKQEIMKDNISIFWIIIATVASTLFLMEIPLLMATQKWANLALNIFFIFLNIFIIRVEFKKLLKK